MTVLCVGDQDNAPFGLIQGNQAVVINPGGKVRADLELCKLTYDYADSGIYNISIENYSRENILFYTVNWQLVCSDLINRSLNESFVCNEIPDYPNYDDLVLNLNKKINISNGLVKYYVDNYKDMCLDNSLSIVGRNGNKFNYLWILLISLLVILFFIVLIYRKRLINMIKLDK